MFVSVIVYNISVSASIFFILDGFIPKQILILDMSIKTLKLKILIDSSGDITRSCCQQSEKPCQCVSLKVQY